MVAIAARRAVSFVLLCSSVGSGTQIRQDKGMDRTLSVVSQSLGSLIVKIREYFEFCSDSGILISTLI
jgi:hypothetical protein